jgi:hypothetical protein
MQAVMRGIFGISELQNLNASPVHICCASELKAWLAFGNTTVSANNVTETPALRNVLFMTIPFVDPA